MAAPVRPTPGRPPFRGPNFTQAACLMGSQPRPPRKHQHRPRLDSNGVAAGADTGGRRQTSVESGGRASLCLAYLSGRPRTPVENPHRQLVMSRSTVRVRSSAPCFPCDSDDLAARAGPEPGAGRGPLDSNATALRDLLAGPCAGERDAPETGATQAFSCRRRTEPVNGRPCARRERRAASMERATGGWHRFGAGARVTRRFLCPAGAQPRGNSAPIIVGASVAGGSIW